MELLGAKSVVQFKQRKTEFWLLLFLSLPHIGIAVIAEGKHREKTTRQLLLRFGGDFTPTQNIYKYWFEQLYVGKIIPE